MTKVRASRCLVGRSRSDACHVWEVFISIVLLFQICDQSSVTRVTFHCLLSFRHFQGKVRPEFDSHLYASLGNSIEKALPFRRQAS
jgi:hypothetical protein